MDGESVLSRGSLPKEESALDEWVAAAARGDVRAWQELVDRYSPLLLGVLRRYRLERAEAEDVAQTVWLRLVEHLGELREPRALPMWICTTAGRECLRQLAVARRAVPRDPLDDAWQTSLVEPDPVDDVERAQRREALLSALGELPEKQRRLLVLLATDPPPSYSEISQRLGIAVGSIGPTRARALERLRACAPVRALLDEAVPHQAGARGDRRA